jgi:hypothetical protein
MRYFIFILLVLCNSCALFNHHSPEKENNKTVDAETKYAVDSFKAADVIVGGQENKTELIIPDPLQAIASNSNVYNISPAYIYYTGERIWQPQVWNLAIAQPIFYNVSASVLQIKSTVDTASLQPATQFTDKSLVTPIKIIPKPAAKILPESKSFIMPYIISGIAAIFLIAFFFFFVKRMKKKSSK